MDLGFIKDSKYFRIRACAVIIKDQKVLMCKNKKHNYYYSVGGAVKHGEKIEDAVIREVFEETGLKMKINRLLFILQNFFNGEPYEFCNNKKYCHTISFYYLMENNNLSLPFFGDENIEWISFKDFKNKNAYPKCLIDMINNKNVKIISSDYK